MKQLQVKIHNVPGWYAVDDHEAEKVLCALNGEYPPGVPWGLFFGSQKVLRGVVLDESYRGFSTVEVDSWRIAYA